MFALTFAVGNYIINEVKEKTKLKITYGSRRNSCASPLL